jgi:hypothetical protein
MYRLHSFTLVTVATDPPAGTPTVTQFLHEQYASGPNMQFASADRGGLEAAFGAKWNSNAPFTTGLAPDGKVLHQKEGKFDLLDLRRMILKNLPDPPAYPGQQSYWNSME